MNAAKRSWQLVAETLIVRTVCCALLKYIFFVCFMLSEQDLKEHGGWMGQGDHAVP